MTRYNIRGLGKDLHIKAVESWTKKATKEVYLILQTSFGQGLWFTSATTPLMRRKWVIAACPSRPHYQRAPTGPRLSGDLDAPLSDTQ